MVRWEYSGYIIFPATQNWATNGTALAWNSFKVKTFAESVFWLLLKSQQGYLTQMSTAKTKLWP